jgi:hypothetical protein
MPGSEPTLLEALADGKLRPVLQAWSKRRYMDDQVDFLVDVNAKKPAKYLYETYIADGADKVLNFGDSEMKSIRNLAKEGDPGYAKMGQPIHIFFEKTLAFLAGNYSQDKGGFLTGEEYQKYLNAGSDPAASRALALLKLTGSKRTSFEPLLGVYLKARSLEDAYQAYLAMLKIVVKARLDPALAAAGKPVVDFPTLIMAEKAKLLAANQAREADKLLPAIKVDLNAAATYFTSALAALKTKGKPASSIEVTRMFSSGRMRMEKLDVGYLKAVKLDKSYITRHADVVASKKKVDAQWAEYKKKLGK